MSRWWNFISGERGVKVTEDDSAGKLFSLKEAHKKKKLEIINTASKDFFPRLNSFYLKWGYDTTLKILAGYSAKLISQSKNKDRDMTQFIQIVQYRVRYFDENK